METYKGKESCSNCRNLYGIDDGFICKSCGKSFCPNCQSDENELCVKCKKEEPPIQPPVDGVNFSTIPFESHLHERFRNIYSVLHFLNQGYDFVHAVKLTVQQFPNITNYQTIADACGRRFAGNVRTFKEWYQNGVMLEKLRSKFYLSNNDYRIFEDLLSKRGRKPLSHIELERKSHPRTVIRKRKKIITKISPKTSQQNVTAGQFVHLGNGSFQFSERSSVKIDANLPSRDVKQELKSNGLYVKNLSSFYYQLRVKANLINK
jgi:hypothetical protein